MLRMFISFSHMIKIQYISHTTEKLVVDIALVISPFPYVQQIVEHVFFFKSAIISKYCLYSIPLGHICERA